MSTEMIALSTDLDVRFGKARLYSTGIEWHGELSAQEWESLAPYLVRTREAHKWWVGDWIVYGENRSQKFGHYYDQAMSAFPGYSYDEIKAFASVSKAVPPEIRNPEVPWGHHAAVVSLPLEKQKELLTAGLTRDEIRRAAKEAKGYLSAARTSGDDESFYDDDEDEDEDDEISEEDLGQPLFDFTQVDRSLYHLVEALDQILMDHPDQEKHHNRVRKQYDQLMKRWEAWKEAARE